MKVYAWRIILQEDGVLNWALAPLGLSGPGFGDVRALARLHVPLAAVHDPSDLCGTRAACPRSLLEASADLGARRCCARSGASCCRSRSLRSWRARSSPSRLRSATTSRRSSSATQQFIGNVVYANVGVAGNLPLAAAFAIVPVAIMIVYLLLARRLGAFESLCSRWSSRAGSSWFLRCATAITLAFIYLPLFVICLYAFNEQSTQNWPIAGLSLRSGSAWLCTTRSPRCAVDYR